MNIPEQKATKGTKERELNYTAFLAEHFPQVGATDHAIKAVLLATRRLKFTGSTRREERDGKVWFTGLAEVPPQMPPMNADGNTNSELRSPISDSSPSHG